MKRAAHTTRHRRRNTMIKVFTTNKDGKIELTKDELKALLDEAYRLGIEPKEA